MSGKRIKNIASESQASQTTNLGGLSDGFVENLLKHAQSKFEVFNSELVKEAVKFINELPSVYKAKELVDGYPVIDYLICTAILLASSFDSNAVVASGLLLYDPLFDRPAAYDILKKHFGSEVAGLVRDVSELSQLSGISRGEEQRNSGHIQDSILNMVQDVRAVMIKIAVRTVQMIILDRIYPKRKKSLVKETLDLHVPLLERLGFSLWKSELENLCASVSECDSELMRSYKSVTKYDVDDISFAFKLENAARKRTIYVRSVEFHKKSLPSIQNKMSRKNITFSDIRDIIRMRITVKTVAECYNAKDVVEKLWSPKPKLGKDYIKNPKANGYKSLHVIVKNAKDQYMKVQIGTSEMKRLPFHYGAHWAYKDRDAHVPLENVKLLVEFASRVKRQAEKSEFLYTGILDGSVNNLLRYAKANYGVFNSELVQKATMFAQRTRKRKERLLYGYPVMEHLISTAIHLATSFNSDIMVASGLLLYGSLDDRMLRYAELKREFGKEVAKLVGDVSKLSKVSEFSRKEPLANANRLPDLILAMGLDARAVAIKIAECIVQMTVLDKLNLEKKGFMNEVLCVYVPLSERLGFNSWKSQLENLCKYADDKVKRVYESVSEKDKDGIAFKDKLEQAMKEENLPYVRVQFRKKSLVSILKKVSNKKEQNKMSEEENDIFKIKDIIGLRIIIEDKENDQGKQDAKEVALERCYQAKGIVAKLWEVEEVKDYIKTPKADGYESLHVIVKNPNNHSMEVQIRTNQMHKKFDDGHWVYKEGNKVQEHVIMLVEMARFSINQAIKVPVYVFVKVRKTMAIEEYPIGTQLKDLCQERGLEGPLKGRVFVNEEDESPNYTLKMGDIIKLPNSSHRRQILGTMQI